MASRVPYESAARVPPQSKHSFAGYAVRQGLAIAMKHNFMMSPAGMDNFRKQLMQLVGSIQLTNDLDVHMALLYAPSYQKYMDEKYYDTQRTIDYLIEDAKNHLQKWGSKPPTFMLCNGALTRQLTMTPERTNYITNGPDGKRKLAQGPDLPSYRGLHIINTRQFSLEAGTAPRDMLRRRVRVCEHYRIPWEITNVSKRFEFYDQARDSMFYMSFEILWNKSFPKDYETLKALLATTLPDNSEKGFDNFEGPGATDVTSGNGCLGGAWFTQSEFAVASMLGVFTGCAPENFQGGGTSFDKFPYIQRKLEFVKESFLQIKADSFCLDLTSDADGALQKNNALTYIFSLLMLKLFIRENFRQYHDGAGARASDAGLTRLMQTLQKLLPTKTSAKFWFYADAKDTDVVNPAGVVIGENRKQSGNAQPGSANKRAWEEYLEAYRDMNYDDEMTSYAASNTDAVQVKAFANSFLKYILCNNHDRYEYDYYAGHNKKTLRPM